MGHRLAAAGVRGEARRRRGGARSRWATRSTRWRTRATGRERLPARAGQPRRAPARRSTRSIAATRRRPSSRSRAAPRSGIAVTHRVLLLVGDAGGTARPGWDAGSRKRPRRGRRAAAERLGRAGARRPAERALRRGLGPPGDGRGPQGACRRLPSRSTQLGCAPSTSWRCQWRSAARSPSSSGGWRAWRTAPAFPQVRRRRAASRLRFERDPSWTAGETALAEHPRAGALALDGSSPRRARSIAATSRRRPPRRRPRRDLGELKTRADDAAAALDDAAKDQRLTRREPLAARRRPARAR